MFEEFKKFAMRGNVLDLAVGVIIGASFTGIVNSLVNDVLMPPIGLALGGVDFSNFFFVLKGDRAVDTLAAAKAADEAPPAPSEEVLLLREIRDSLQRRA